LFAIIVTNYTGLPLVLNSLKNLAVPKRP